MQFKKLATIGIISSFLFAGCSGGGSTTSTTTTVKEGNVLYDNTAFSLQIPKQWEVIDKTSFTSNVPAETVVGFRNNIKSDIFTANVNIAQKTLTTPTLAKDFAKSSLEILRNNLIGYTLLNEKDGKMTYGKDGLATYSTEFEGKKSASEQIIHFKQLYVINNNIAYTVSAAYLPNEDKSVVTTIGEMLDSFSLK